MSAGSVDGAPQGQCMASVDGILRVQQLPGAPLAFQGHLSLCSPLSEFPLPSFRASGGERENHKDPVLVSAPTLSDSSIL